jgi:signal transduction histidine kinase
MVEIFKIYLLESYEIDKNWRIEQFNEQFNNVGFVLQLPQALFWEEAIAVLQLLPQVTIDHQITATAYPQINQLSLVGDTINEFNLVIPSTEHISNKENPVFGNFYKIKEQQYIFLTPFVFINKVEYLIITRQNLIPLLIVSQIADLDRIFEVENKHVFHLCKSPWINLLTNELMTVHENSRLHTQWLVCSDLKGANLLKLNAPSGNCELIENCDSEYYSKALSLLLESPILDGKNGEFTMESTNLLGVQDSTTDYQSIAFSWVCEKQNREIGCKQLLSNDTGEHHRQVMNILHEQQNPSLEQKVNLSLLPKQLGELQRLTSLFHKQLTDLPNLLKLIVEEVCVAIESADFCLIALQNIQTQQLEIRANYGIAPEELSLFKINSNENITGNNTDNGLLEKVFRTGVTQLFGSQDSRISSSLIHATVIESGTTGCLGVLAVGNWNNPYAFNNSEKDFLHLVTDVAAVAINNAKQFQELKEQNQELEKTRHQVQLQHLELLQAAKIKSQFLSTTSHELRTPLNVIMGLSQVLLRQRTSGLSQPQAEMIQRILSNGNHLLTIIEDMLYFVQNETDRLSFNIQEFNFRNLVFKTVTEHLSLADEKSLNLQVEVNLKNPLVVNDSVRLKEVLLKLLLNALKFTENGSVEVKVWEINSDKIAIAVTDTGIGIAESNLDMIFEQFRQVDQTTTRKYGGIGLGLAIAKSLVHLMQGNISVKSELGKGSTFYVEIPRVIQSIRNS